MNQFGRLFRLSIYGESHGPAVGIVIDGCPPGLPLDPSDFIHDLHRRRGGTHDATTPRQEEDVPQLLSGVFQGRTTGSPLHIQFVNRSMISAEYEARKALPRPGHADFVASRKFNGFEDYRGGGHFSGRLTVALTAAGTVAKKLWDWLDPAHVPQVRAHIVSIQGQTDLEAALRHAREKGDTVGGIVECRVDGLPVGWGEPFFDSVESLLGHAVFSIPAIRGIEFGTGFAAAEMYGSEHNDAILDKHGTTETNHAGGVVGGLTNGNPLVFRVAVKPPSSTPAIQESLNMESGVMERFQVRGRHDLCLALRVPVVLEAVTACVLADLALIHRSVRK